VEKPRRGLLTTTVPGLVDVWRYIYENYATKDLEKLLRPAISLATNVST
jgi:gamma-glutamyltranspeptidase/glutathione hydrolase